MAQPVETVARAKLSKLVETGCWGQRELAREVLVAQPTVRAWLEGMSRPEPHLRKCVELVTGIPAQEWETADEHEHVERVRAQLGPDRLAVVSAPTARRAAAGRTGVKPVVRKAKPAA